ncbi:nuclear cap-binding protein subunit 3-like isoform X2 [Stegodyphus dumicola]|uniref:nuclear cap-binding protein subunit 3-like isoform X2 n=1 Tax=Stegodyphus dumicola TaxID=202533 RepID=UPI0015AB3FEE|nr:nuclear cap-binding protein subunit 3-like isoform X2 [Stegodyphus dumicola]
MAHILMGKLLPNLKVTLGNDETEEGEITDSVDISENSEPNNETQKQSVEIVRTWMETLQTPKIYENKNGAFITGLDLSSEVLLKKLEERAARFGLEKNDESQITQQRIDALYKSLDIDPENLSLSKVKNIRLDAIHMRGVEEMSTNEIFQYFSEYGPSSVEWINDFSCNVVWLDETSAARALLGMSRPLVVKKKSEEKKESVVTEIDINSNDATMTQSLEKEAVILMSDSEESEDDEESSSSKDEPMDVDIQKGDTDCEGDATSKDVPPVDVPVPPGHWRLGIPHPKAKAILLRFATKDDKKLPGAEKRSQYYQKYGNPNYGDADKNITSRPIRNKQPRMRMYADDEEEKNKSRVFVRSRRSDAFRSTSRSVHSRLGAKYTKDDLFHLGRRINISDEEDTEKVPVIRKVTSRFNIWTDIAKSMADEESSRKDFYKTSSRSSQNSRSRLFQNLRSRQTEDLRSTLNSSSFRRKSTYSSHAPEDLRSKIKRLRRDTLNARRSPLFRDDDND